MLKRIIVGESGGPTPVIDWEVCGIMDAAQRGGLEIYGMMNGLEGLLNANIKGNIVDLTNFDPMSFAFNGPGAGLRTTRLKPTLEQYKKMAANLAALKVDGVVYIGGNDSADQLLGLTRQCDLAAIHAIKTVDNDLPVTHHCPGYGSAALYNAVALKNVHNDFSSYQVWGNFEKDGRIVQALSVAPVIIYQVMGRKAGWLAHSTAFAKVDPRGILMPKRPPHIILSKEMLFDKREFLDQMDNIITRSGEAVVTVQEDLTDKETGEDIAKRYSEEVVTDAHGNIQHGRADSFSTSLFLAQMIHKELKVESVLGKIKEAALVPQHIQRSNVMSPPDASEAYMVGYAAVEAMLAGETQKSVVLKRPDGKTVTGLTDLANIAAKDRCMPLDYINGLNGPTQEFIDEFIYLIGGAMGIPHYSYRKFKFQTVPIPAEIRDYPYIKGKDEYKWPLKGQSIIQ